MKKWKNNRMNNRPMGSGYGLGVIGAAAYYLHTTTGFWPGVVGLLKACVWPAFLVYHLLGL